MPTLAVASGATPGTGMTSTSEKRSRDLADVSQRPCRSSEQALTTMTAQARRRVTPDEAYVDLCEWTTRKTCSSKSGGTTCSRVGTLRLRSGSPLTVSAKVHFVQDIKPHTDPSLGDCSYLNSPSLPHPPSRFGADTPQRVTGWIHVGTCTGLSRIQLRPRPRARPSP